MTQQTFEIGASVTITAWAQAGIVVDHEHHCSGLQGYVVAVAMEGGGPSFRTWTAEELTAGPELPQYQPGDEIEFQGYEGTVLDIAGTEAVIEVMRPRKSVTVKNRHRIHLWQLQLGDQLCDR